MQGLNRRQGERQREGGVKRVSLAGSTDAAQRMLINGVLNGEDFVADELQNPHVAVVNLQRQMVCSKQPSEKSSLDGDQKGRRVKKK